MSRRERHHDVLGIRSLTLHLRVQLSECKKRTFGCGGKYVEIFLFWCNSHRFLLFWESFDRKNYFIILLSTRGKWWIASAWCAKIYFPLLSHFNYLGRAVNLWVLTQNFYNLLLSTDARHGLEVLEEKPWCLKKNLDKNKNKWNTLFRNAYKFLKFCIFLEKYSYFSDNQYSLVLGSSRYRSASIKFFARRLE